MASVPVVSVLLPVYNREQLVGDAIRSVLKQNFTNFELLVVDDGSTDGSLDVVRSFEDARIRIVEHETNRGIPTTRNSALDHARGRYLAWLDSDDLARPCRLAEQVAFLECNSDIVMVGSCAGKIGRDGRPLPGVRLAPFVHEDVLAWQLFTPAFQQSSLMGRAEVLQRYRYREDHPVCEDLELASRVTRDHRTANIPKVLIDRRLHAGQSVETLKPEIAAMQARLLRSRLEEIGVPSTAIEFERHIELGLMKVATELPPAEYLRWAEAWLERLIAANAHSRALDGEALRFAIGYTWFRACRRAMRSREGRGLARLLSTPIGFGLFGGHGRKWLSQALPLLAGRA